MEHRWTERKPVRVNAVLRYDDLGLVTGKLRDLSFGGAYVETSAASFLPRNALVQVVLAEPSASGATLTHLRAVVARRAVDGIGMMFTDLDPDTLVTLRRVIHGTASGTSSGQVQSALQAGAGTAAIRRFSRPQD